MVSSIHYDMLGHLYKYVVKPSDKLLNSISQDLVKIQQTWSTSMYYIIFLQDTQSNE